MLTAVLCGVVKTIKNVLEICLVLRDVCGLVASIM